MEHILSASHIHFCEPKRTRTSHLRRNPAAFLPLSTRESHPCFTTIGSDTFFPMAFNAYHMPSYLKLFVAGVGFEHHDLTGYEPGMLTSALSRDIFLSLNIQKIYLKHKLFAVGILVEKNPQRGPAVFKTVFAIPANLPTVYASICEGSLNFPEFLFFVVDREP